MIKRFSGLNSCCFNGILNATHPLNYCFQIVLACLIICFAKRKNTKHQIIEQFNLP